MFPRKTCVPLSVLGVFRNTSESKKLNRVKTSSLSALYKSNNCLPLKKCFPLLSLLCSNGCDDY